MRELFTAIALTVAFCCLTNTTASAGEERWITISTTVPGLKTYDYPIFEEFRVIKANCRGQLIEQIRDWCLLRAQTVRTGWNGVLADISRYDPTDNPEGAEDQSKEFRRRLRALYAETVLLE